MLRRFLHFDSFLTSDFKKPTCFTFILTHLQGKPHNYLSFKNFINLQINLSVYYI